MSKWDDEELALGPGELQEADALLRRPTRPAEMPVYNDPNASIFAGPVSENVPSSVSSMKRDRSRSKSDSRRPSLSVADTDDDENYQQRRPSSKAPSRRSSSRRLRHKRSNYSSASRRQSSSHRPSDASSTLSNHDHRPTAASAASLPNPIESGSSSSEGSSDDDAISNTSKKRNGGSRYAPSVASRNNNNNTRPSSRMSRRSGHARHNHHHLSRRSSRDSLVHPDDSAHSEHEGFLDYGSGSESEYPEPFGPYGSSVSGSSNSDQSSSSVESITQEFARARQHSRGAVSAPFEGVGVSGGTDPVFGETRIPIDPYESSEAASDIDENESPKYPYTQTVYIPDQDLHVVFHGWGYKTYKTVLWTIACICSLGILSLIGRWFPDIWLNGTCKRRSFRRADFLVAQTPDGTRHVLPMNHLRFNKPVPLNQIFPYTLAGSSTFSSSSQDSAPPPPQPPSSSASGNIPQSNLGTDPNSASNQYTTSCRSIEYRYHRFILHPVLGEFIAFRDWNDSGWTDIKSLRRGVTSNQVLIRQIVFGPNEIDIKGQSIMQLLFDEVLHPFYIFQLFSIILWSLDDYYYYAATILIISVSSITTTLIETRKNIQRMKEMSRFTCPIKVYRQDSWSVIDSSMLVPGDLIDVSDTTLESFPCDSILLSGDALVNECMLTGESVPVSKIPANNETVGLMHEASIKGEVPSNLSKNILYSGTRIIRIRSTTSSNSSSSNSSNMTNTNSSNNGGEAIAMVFRTGFNTTKGALVRSMLFPKPIGFKFYRDSFNFIGVLALIAAFGFIFSAVNFVRMGIKSSTILLKALDLITVVVPPALPATMSIGTSFALARLRSKSIHCISPTRINVGGKIDVAAFDKTGTLTEDGLDVLGVHYVARSQPRTFSDLETDLDSIPMGTGPDEKIPLVHALTTCHSLKIVNGEVLGDPLDLRMFEYTQWTLEEGKEQSARPSVETSKKLESAARKGTSSKPASANKTSSSKVPPRPPTLVQTIVRPPGGQTFELEDALKAGKKHAHFLELGVIRTFEFVSALRRMSVLVKRFKSKTVEAYVKGAPEVMVDICDKSTLPEDYDEVLDYYTRRGFRVIALAAKSLPNLTWLKAQRLKREQVESDLRFIGLIIFENKLKEATVPTIHTLRSARIGVRMCTGDNIRTAISVGRECGMVGHHTKVYTPVLVDVDENEQRYPNEQDLHWYDVENEKDVLDPYSLEPIIRNEDNEIVSLSSSILEEFPEYALAIPGDLFRWMLDNSALETLQQMLVKGVIFARMSPDEKHELVERLQSIGYTVSFCGDGANDCGALRAADVGISLSEAEASVAAPFTSRVADISCVVEVIKEGRAALVTSFSCFKYMALYSLIQFTTISLLYAIASTLGDFQFLSIDLFIIIPIAVTMGRTEAFPVLSTKRPTTNLVSKKVLTSLIGQIVITSFLQFFLFFYVRMQPWYAPPNWSPGEIEVSNYENSTLFLFSSWQYILVAMVFSTGPPYRKPFYTNFSFVAVLAVLYIFVLTMLFSSDGKGSLMRSVFEIIDMPREFKLEILLIVILNGGLSWVWEYGLALTVAGWIGKFIKNWKKQRHGKRKENGKVYKALQRGNGY